MHGCEGECEDAAENIDKAIEAEDMIFFGRVMDVACCGFRNHRKTDCHTQRRAHEHFAVAEDVVERCLGGSEDLACDGVDGVEEQLGVRVCYTYIFDEEG